MTEGTHNTPQDLFIHVIDRLRAQYDPYQPIPGVIADMCRFFGFGCGFIYETDHTGVFFLRERYCNYSDDALKERLYLDQALEDRQIADLSHSPIVFFPTRAGISETDAKLAELFGVNSLLMVTLDGIDGRPIGLVGMSDRRGRILLSSEEINVAHSILLILANHVKLRLYQKKVQNSQKAMESMLDNMGIDVYVKDFYTHDILYANRPMAELFGGKEQLIGKKCWQTFFGDGLKMCRNCPQPTLIDENGNPTGHYSWDFQRPDDKSWFHVVSAAFPWVDGRLAHVVSSVDITENKRNEEIIRQLAEYDNLTGLPNRRKLLADLSGIISGKGSELRRGFVLFFDLDNFKMVNDTLGHRAGDELLSEIGRLFQKNPLLKDKCYRHSGDEFVLILADLSSEQADEVIAYILERFSAPWVLRDGNASCSTSIGAARFPEDGSDAEELIHKADMAMYIAKRSGKNGYRHYSDSDFSCNLD